MWLKYGAKAVKVEASSRRKKSERCDDLLTLAVDKEDWAGL